MSPKDTATEAAKKAGFHLKEHLGKISDITLKGRNDFVTNLDVECENIIKKIIKDTYPVHGIVAEESEIENSDSEYTWFIDPLSGTTNYIHSLPFFSVAIALRKDKDFILGVVYDPLLDELFMAETGRGAYLNNQKVTVSLKSQLEDAIICLTLKKKTPGQEKESVTYFERLFPITTVKIMGSTALHMCYVACGRSEGFIEVKSDVFATPAGKVILEESGGMVTDFGGKAWTPESLNVIASNKSVHYLLLNKLNGDK